MNHFERTDEYEMQDYKIRFYALVDYINTKIWARSTVEFIVDRAELSFQVKGEDDKFYARHLDDYDRLIGLLRKMYLESIVTGENV